MENFASVNAVHLPLFLHICASEIKNEKLKINYFKVTNARFCQSREC